MSWDPVSAVGTAEPLYFGPLSGYDTTELDKRGLDQDKKTAQGFKWFPKKTQLEKKPDDKNPVGRPVKAWEESSSTLALNKGQDSKNTDLDDMPTWDEFSQKTTFHGVRYIFDRTQFKIRRYLNYI